MVTHAEVVTLMLLALASLVRAAQPLSVSLTMDGVALADLRFDETSDLLAVAEAYLRAHPELPAEPQHLVEEMVRVVETSSGTELSINDINPPFVVPSRGDPRVGLSGYCSNHGVGAFDCATAHRAAQRIGHGRLPVHWALATDSLLDPRAQERHAAAPVQYRGRVCDAATRSAQRLAFLRSFPPHEVDDEGFLQPAAIDHNIFAWPYSGGLEAESVHALMDLLLGGGGLSGGLSRGLGGGDGSGGQCAVLVDVGANEGDFTALLLDVAARHQEQRQAGARPWCVHMLEPAVAEAARLRARFSVAWPLLASAAVHEVAASDAPREAATMYFPRRDVGSREGGAVHACGTLHAILYDSKFGRGETKAVAVRVVTIDALVRDALGDAAVVDLLKIDAEGADAGVLRGAAQLLAEGRVKAVLFEYGHGWVGAPDTAGENLGAVVAWLDALGLDAYLVGAGASLLFLSGGCWSVDFETWAWSNVVAVSRAAAPLAAARLDAASLVKPAPPSVGL